MSRRYLTRPEFNAILAGLHCLQQVREQCGGDLPDDLIDILENCEDDGLSDEGIDQLCEDLNFDGVELMVEGESEREGRFDYEQEFAVESEGGHAD